MNLMYAREYHGLLHRMPWKDHKKIANVNSGLVLLVNSAQWLSRCIIGWTVECFALKPYWCLYRELFEFKKILIY